MKLDDYFQLNRGARQDVARTCGKSAAYFHHVAKDRKACAPETAVAIVKATSGIVTLRDMLPSEKHPHARCRWLAIWPDLASSSLSLDPFAAGYEELTGLDTSDLRDLPRPGPDRLHPEPEKAA